jgi:hypothetical protein
MANVTNHTAIPRSFVLLTLHYPFQLGMDHGCETFEVVVSILKTSFVKLYCISLDCTVTLPTRSFNQPWKMKVGWHTSAMFCFCPKQAHQKKKSSAQPNHTYAQYKDETSELEQQAPMTYVPITLSPCHLFCLIISCITPFNNGGLVYV